MPTSNSNVQFQNDSSTLLPERLSQQPRCGDLTNERVVHRSRQNGVPDTTGSGQSLHPNGSSHPVRDVIDSITSGSSSTSIGSSSTSSSSSGWSSDEERILDVRKVSFAVVLLLAVLVLSGIMCQKMCIMIFAGQIKDQGPLFNSEIKEVDATNEHEVNQDPKVDATNEHEDPLRDGLDVDVSTRSWTGWFAWGVRVGVLNVVPVALRRVAANFEQVEILRNYSAWLQSYDLPYKEWKQSYDQYQANKDAIYEAWEHTHTVLTYAQWMTASLTLVFLLWRFARRK